MPDQTIKTRLQCNKCGRFVTSVLEPVSNSFEPDWPDCANMIPRGHYWLAHSIAPESMNGQYVIHLEDRMNLSYHPDPLRHQGCCGRSSFGRPNQICLCGAEIATEISDCWTSYFAYFQADAVTLVQALDLS